MKRSLACVLSLILIASSINNLACDRDSVRKVKEASERIVIYCDAGLQVVEELIHAKILKVEIGNTLAVTIGKIRAGMNVFATRAATYTKFDATSRADLLKLFGDVLSGINELHQLGISVSSNPRFQRVLSGLMIAARLIESRLN